MEQEEFEKLLGDVQTQSKQMKEVIDFYKENKISREEFAKIVDIVGKIEANSTKGSPTADPVKAMNKAYSDAFFSSMKAGSISIPDNVKFSANQSVHKGPEGGYFVPVDVQSEIMRIIDDSSAVSQYCKLYTTSRNTIEIPYEIGGASCGWVGEEEVGNNSSSIKFGTKKIMVNKMFANVSYTREMLSDADIDIRSEFTTQLGKKFVISENNGILYGTGAKSPEGLLTKASDIPVANVDLTASGAWKALIMVTAKLPVVNRASYAWYMNNKTRTYIRCMEDTSGRNAFNITLDKDGVDMLEGFPIRVVPELPDFDSVVDIANAVPKTTKSILFGSLPDTYAVARNGGMETLEDPYTQKKAGIVEYSTWSRMGGGVLRKDQMYAINTRR